MRPPVLMCGPNAMTAARAIFSHFRMRSRGRPGARLRRVCGAPRSLVERFFNKIEHCRRVATRYDKLAANYLAFIQLAAIRLWLRVNEFTPLIPSVSRLGSL